MRLATLADALREGHARVAVWGGGFVGYSSAATLARQGVQALVVDIDPDVLAEVRAGRCPVPHLRDWLGFDPAPLVASGHLWACEPHIDMLFDAGMTVHLIAVPTERDAKPWLDPLFDVIERIGQIAARGSGGRQLVIIESTLIPGTTERVAAALADHPEVLVAVAPRRDWFVGAAHTLRTLPRIYAGCDEAAADEAQAVLSLMCDSLHRASGVREAELTKALENSDRHVRITLANQVAQAFDVDADELQRLAATKWNYGPAWVAGLGIGGYCLPVAPLYLLAGAAKPDELTLLSSAVEYATALPARIAGDLAGYGRVAVLGLTYRPDLTVVQESPGIALARALTALGVEVVVHDPLLTPEAVSELLPDATHLTDIEALPGQSVSAVVVAVAHRQYVTLSPRKVRTLLRGVRALLDAGRIWLAHAPDGCMAVRPGLPGLRDLKELNDGTRPTEATTQA